MVTASKAARLAGERALDQGLAAVLVRRGNHFGAAGHYALELAEAGLLALVTSNAPANMTVTGSRGAVLGNAPIAYASPAGRRPPIVFDVALSAVAGSKVIMAAERGETVPQGWFVDSSGRYDPDPRAFVTEKGVMLGTLVPMAGHKGYGLALLVELLAGALSGAAMAAAVPSWARHPAQPGDTGHAVIALHPEAFLPGGVYVARVEALADSIQAAPRAPGVDRILLPGELEHERELESLASGILLDETVWRQLGQLAGRLGLASALEAARLA
jgi:LDH2 family malate/lactate/ureidoglycolate dehydrogenase